jgi:hypothetical protein
MPVLTVFFVRFVRFVFHFLAGFPNAIPAAVRVRNVSITRITDMTCWVATHMTDFILAPTGPNT